MGEFKTLPQHDRLAQSDTMINLAHAVGVSSALKCCLRADLTVVAVRRIVAARLLADCTISFDVKGEANTAP